jgi:hypothetical protein
VKSATRQEIINEKKFRMIIESYDFDKGIFDISVSKGEGEEIKAKGLTTKQIVDILDNEFAHEYQLRQDVKSLDEYTEMQIALHDKME